MHAPKIFVLKGSGTPDYDGLIQGISECSANDWKSFLAECGDVSMTELERFKAIARSGYYPVGSVFVFPGGHVMRISDALELGAVASDGETPVLSRTGIAIKQVLNNPGLRFRALGSCAGAALLSRELQINYPGFPPLPCLGILPDTAAIGSLHKGPAMHELLDGRDAIPAQLGWDNIGFSSDKKESEVVATYKSGTTAIMQNSKAFATGPHLEAMHEGSELRALAEKTQGVTLPFFATAETEVASARAAKKMVDNFLRPETKE